MVSNIQNPAMFYQNNFLNNKPSHLKMDISDRFTHICHINDKSIGNRIKTAGVIGQSDENFFTIFSYMKRGSGLAGRIKCTYCQPLQEGKGYCAIIKGTVHFEEDLYILTDEIQQVDEDDVKIYGVSSHYHPIKRNANPNSYFNEENLSDLKMSTPQELITFLKQKAFAEGFELVRKESITKAYITLRCKFHSKYGKKMEINTNCNFYVSISRIHDPQNYKNFIWHIASFCNSHNHKSTPFHFADHLLSDEQVKLIHSLYISGVNYGVISNVMKNNYKIDISREHIRHVCLQKKNERIQQRLTETEELENYMISTDGIARFDEYLGEDGLIHRKAVATFTKEEIYNLEKFGDFIAIDPTFYTMSSNWSIIPLTVIGPESNTNEDRFLWILKLLLYELPSKEILTTICSDDDSGLNAAFRARLSDDDFQSKKSDLNRVICFWHKLSTFISL